MSLHEKIIQASNALTENQLDLAAKLVDDAKKEILNLDKNAETIQLAANLGGVMIDLGSWTTDYEMVRSGTLFALEIVEAFPKEHLFLNHFYNLANGYSAMRKIEHQAAFDNGKIPDYYVQEKAIYRKAIALARTKKLDDHENSILPELFINYANTLDAMGRPVEALLYYDKALAKEPSKPEALGNKAMVFANLALSAHGHTHLFILEAKRLFEHALANAPHPQLEKHLKVRLDNMQKLINQHTEDLEPEEYEASPPSSKFHEFLREFCFKNQLYLTPSSLIGQRQYQFFGDPLFITQMTADINDSEKFDRYITFFNQIKQDYIFARYLLIQSQFEANHAEVIDQDVDYYYPLDYSLYSSYVEMMKVSFRLAIDTLDKIAFFVRDYCQISSLTAKTTNFRNVWSTKNEPLMLRPELNRKNVYLFGLLDLALDLREGGYLSQIYERRNALTHRFLSVHSEAILKYEESEDLPKVQINNFLKETVLALQILKAAVIYLILFINLEESRTRNEGLVVPTFSPKVGETFRWKPSHS